MDAVHGQGRRAAPDRTDADAGEVEVLLVAFRGWLTCERGLATESVRCYGSQASTFLAQLPAPLEESLAGLDAAAVITFVLGQAAAANSVWSAKAQVTALRSLLRFVPLGRPGPRRWGSQGKPSEVTCSRCAQGLLVEPAALGAAEISPPPSRAREPIHEPPDDRCGKPGRGTPAG